ncbi:MAG TPA: hypothetical protein VNJ04_07945 [Gemmatimonadaceae bacterium]|nr:hypothetical protein [Gemmatimonadaceae bacterium]
MSGRSHAAFKAQHGEVGGEVNENNAVIIDSPANIGATVMGRTMFGGHPGGWRSAKPWNGPNVTHLKFARR